MTGSRLLAILAHADDESSCCGGTPALLEQVINAAEEQV